MEKVVYLLDAGFSAPLGIPCLDYDGSVKTRYDEFIG
jgi:hypothetical protein